MWVMALLRPPPASWVRAACHPCPQSTMGEPQKRWVGGSWEFLDIFPGRKSPHLMPGALSFDIWGNTVHLSGRKQAL